MAGEGQLVHVPKGPAPEEDRAAQTQLTKWGRAGKAGFQVVPNVLFRAQSHLKIDCVDVVILLNLSMHWWGPFNLPYPSPQLLAQRMSLSRRTIERHLQNLEKKGLIARLPARAPQEGKPKVRSFDMSGLVERLEGAASTNLRRREAPKKSGAYYMLTG
jgi:DNA-binding transcriptional ArsR family regulator